ncbi:MAG TPA: FtsW/RodA/SpoVE family cell cycle protein [Egibacteraceae bacterium]|nr:FtsW/RodA/SpoVE family cell cycle protein [Egibacteraceae bacterium]
MSAGTLDAQLASTNRRRANTELALLVLALVTVLVAYALVGLAQSGVLPSGLIAYGGALAALAAAGHLVSRRLAPGGDPLLLPVAFLLNGLGLVMVRRIDFASAAGANPTNLAPAQTAWTVIAIAAFCATLLVLSDHRVLDRYRYLVGIGSLVLLSLPTLLPEPIGRTINGATLWLNFGVFSIQPAEFAKLGLVVFFASYLAEKRQLLAVATNRVGPLMVPPARAFGPVLVAWGLSLGILVLQNDFGLSLLFFGVFAVLLYVATTRVAYVAIAGALFAGGAYVAYTLFSHVQVRIAVWLDPWSVYETGGFQIAQSLFALATGGITGVGLGQGHPDFIPFVQTDFIFAAFGEELGLLGTTALLLCYFILVGRGFAVAMRSRDDFGTLLAAGLTVIFALQTFVIVGGVTRLIPLSGLTLPFVSYGGSSLLANYVLVALLLRVSAAATVESARAGAAA